MNYSQANLAALNKRTEKLLISCIKKDIPSGKQEIIAFINEGVDFQALSEMACNEGVASLVWRALNFYRPRNEQEEKALKILQISYLATLAANSYYQEELKQILKYFEKQKIPVIPLKGITLSHRLYNDIVSRDQSADTDLLVKEEDKERAEQTLLALGYSSIPISEQKQYDWYSLFKKPQARMIELHWDITMMVRNPLRIQGLWEGTELIEWEGLVYRDFNPEELLLYLCAHLASSNAFRQLKYLCDINRLLEKYGNVIKWDDLIDKAIKWRLRSSLYAALNLNARIFEINFSRKLLNKLHVSLPKRTFIHIFANEKAILRQGWRKRFLASFLSYVFFELIEANSFKEHLKIFQKVLFPPKELMKGRNYFTRIFNGLTKFK